MRRRTFLKTTTAAAAFHVVGRHVLGGAGGTAPSDKLAIAGVGVGGQGGGVLKSVDDQAIVALCDVDSKKAGGTFKRYPKAEQFKDYRRMLDKRKDVDAVVIATPDHMHAPVTLACLRAGKHVYTEKPMAHSIEEARVMTRAARETGLVTQMGNNGHGGEGLRLTREYIQAGAIGKVREVHCWSDRPGRWWPQPVEPPTAGQPVPEHLDWNLWLGCARARPYHPAYHPFKWRAWFDFGTGALGDMAVHNMDPAFYALDLGAPVAVEAKTSALPRATYPAWQIVTYEFAPGKMHGPLKVIWYDGGKMPPRPDAFDEGYTLPDNGIYFVGEKGVIQCGGWAGAPRLFPRRRRAEFEKPEKTIPRSPGHRDEWVQACKEGNPKMAKAGFWYSGPFTEALLVGTLAIRLQKRIEWDAEKMEAKHVDASALIRKRYRKGFGI